MSTVEIFYDFSCPYAYLGHTQIEAVCARHGATLVWKPFLLGGVFRAIGTPDMPALSMPAAKAAQNALDMLRWAAFLGVPFTMPATHPNRTVLALRAAIASDDLPAASKALFAAYWVRGLDVSQPHVVVEALNGAGLDGAALVRDADRPEIKDKLRALTDEAIAAGVFGAPAFRVTTTRGGETTTELYWGQDRLALVEDQLREESGVPSQKHLGSKANVGGASRATVDFFFDVSSPFAYLASERIEALAAEAGADLVWRPFLLGGLFKAIGTPEVPMFAAPPAKQRHAMADMLRWAKHFGIPFRFPTRFPMVSVKALRLLLAAPEAARAGLAHALFRAYWADDRDIADDRVLAEIAGASRMDATAGRMDATASRMDATAVLERAKSPEVKAALFAATDEAKAAGVFGAPSFVVRSGGEPQLFWGQDRFDFVRAAIAGYRFDAPLRRETAAR